MKKYNTPVIELNKFDVADSILALSGGSTRAASKISTAGQALKTSAGTTNTNAVEFWW